MTTREGNALDVLLFGEGGEETLVDIKCYRGEREGVSPQDISRQVQEGLLQHFMHPGRATNEAPRTSAEPVKVSEFVSRLKVAA